MKRTNTALFLLILILAGCESGCAPGGGGTPNEGPETLSVAVWNLQTLFDGKEAGNEYRDFLESAGWTDEKYRARLITISQAILAMAQDSRPASSGEPDKQQAAGKASPPDLIGFAEIENLTVLEDLAGGALSSQGYYWAAFANIPGASLGIGALSRFPITEARAHSITIGKDTAPRPVLEVRIEPGGKPLVFLICHWKSKLGEDSATTALRRASAKVVRRLLAELNRNEEDTPVIVMGDLNENHDEFYRRSGSILSALLPDDPDVAALAAAMPAAAKPGISAGSGFQSTPDYLVLSAEKPPRASYFSEGTAALYTPWDNEMSGQGSYYYRENWETIDHVLLSEGLFSGSGWEFAGCRVLNRAPFVTSSGTPNSYVARHGRGLSDHLPLLLFLHYSKP